MHDIDRALFEGQEEGGTWGEVSGEQSGLYLEGGSYESQEGETASYGDSGSAGELWGESGPHDGGELALAAELLMVTSDRELDQFLGNLVKGAVSAAGSFAASDAGKAVVDILKSSARRALPQIGQAVGDYISPGAGGQAGQRVGQWLGTKFETGLQLEGLSSEDRDFETARACVRYMDSAVKRVAATPVSVPASVAAKQAAAAAARQHLPGLLQAPTTVGQRGERHTPERKIDMSTNYYPGETQDEFEWIQGGTGESNEGEYEDEYEENLQSELAMELLGISSEEELDQFLGKLARSVVKGAGNFIKSPIGKLVGGALKTIAKTALPIAGGAIGSFIAPGIGTAIGSKLGSMAGGLLEVEEAEAMDESEAEVQKAHRLVQVGQAAFRNAARTPRSVPPAIAARAALTSAARRHAPSLLRPESGYRNRRRAPQRRTRVYGAPYAGAVWGAPQDGGDKTPNGADEGRWFRDPDTGCLVIQGL